MASMGQSGKLPSFTSHVVDAMNKLYPLALADARWDNVGLLLDNFPLENQQPIVLLANDLTTAVCEEAIAKQASVIVAYHPFIFRGLKAITHNDTQQSSLLRLARHGVAVYCPHTSVDAAPGGINDWLADACIGSTLVSESSATIEEASRTILQSVPGGVLPAGFEGAGYGRKVTLKSAIPARMLLANLKEELGVSFANVAFRQPGTLDAALDRKISSFAVCAGSGADVFGDCDADVLVTGELSHHAALKYAERGQLAVALMHSSSERGFLKDRLAPRLLEVLSQAGVNAEVFISEKDVEIFHVYTG